MKSAKTFIYPKIPIDSMNTQINLRLPEKLLISAKEYVKNNGFTSIQEFIKETIREKLFPEREFSKKEIKLIENFIDKVRENDDFGTEEELWEALGSKPRCNTN